MLSDTGPVPSSFDNALKEYVRGGGAVFIALGHNSAGQSKLPVVDNRIAGTRYAGSEGERFQVASWLDTAHSAIQKDNNWEGVKFFQAIKVEPGNARIVGRLSDDTPLILDQQIGDGHVLIFASTLDNIANDFPLHPSFVPFIEQSARYLGRMDTETPARAVGSFEELRDGREKGAAVDVVDPKGSRVFDLKEATTAQNVQFTMTGFYDVRRPNGRNELVAVTMPTGVSPTSHPRRRRT